MSTKIREHYCGIFLFDHFLKILIQFKIIDILYNINDVGGKYKIS